MENNNTNNNSIQSKNVNKNFNRNRNRNKNRKNKVYYTNDNKSRIVFEIDDDLKNIITKTTINKNVVRKLIELGYIGPKFSEDEMAIQLAFVLIANEVSEQIIEDVNSDEQP